MKYARKMTTLRFHRYFEASSRVPRNEFWALSLPIVDELDVKSSPNESRRDGDLIPGPLELVACSKALPKLWR